MSATYIESLHAEETVRLRDGEVRVICSSYVDTSYSMAVFAGPFSMCLTDAEAIELGNALIRMAHHRTAAMAEYRAVQNDKAAQL